MESLFKENGKNELIYFDGSEWISKEISDERTIDFLNEFDILGKHSDILIFYHALKENILQLKQFLSSVVLPNGDYVEYSRANRHTLNTLSMFYSLISFCEKNINEFNSIVSTIYDKYFSYRLFYNLRNYMTHKGLGITGFEANLINGEFKTEAIIYSKELINYKKGNAKFRKELQDLNIEKIKIKEHLDEFIDSIDELIFSIFLNAKKEIINAFKNLRDVINAECSTCNETFLKEKNNHKHGLLKSLNNFINIFSNEIIYSNKIEQNPQTNYEVFELFSLLSFIYFGKTGVGVKPMSDSFDKKVDKI